MLLPEAVLSWMQRVPFRHCMQPVDWYGSGTLPLVRAERLELTDPKACVWTVFEAIP